MADKLGDLSVGDKLHAVYKADGEFYMAEVVSISRKRKTPVKVHYAGYADTDDAWVSIDQLKSKKLGLKGKPPAEAPKAKGAAKAKGKAAAKKEPTPDYSELKKGLRIQAKAEDNKYYAAEVVVVAKGKQRSAAPVKVHWVGYTDASDEWIGADRIRSKALKFVSPGEKGKEKAGKTKAYSAKEKEYLQANYPKDLDGVKGEWIGKLLHTPVSAISIKKKLEAGVTGDAAIINCAYNNSYQLSAKGPGSVVLKYAKDNEASRQLAQEAQMYEKEVMLYTKLFQRISKVLPIPKVLGTFVDEEKPSEFFVIAMEDLSIDFNPMDQIKGISHEEGLALAPLVAKLHAEFWGDEILKNPVVCAGNPNKCNIWFEAWTQGTIADPHMIDGFYTNCLNTTKMPKVDFYPTERHKTMVRLYKKHGKAIIEEFHKILDSRPFTLVHGDMRADNLFQKKPELGKGFKFIDWQTFAAAPPGVEMVQLFSGSFTNLEDLEFEKLGNICELYLKTLHEKKPASKVYTVEMLKEDWGMTFAMLSFGMPAPFGPLMDALPEGHPLWKLFATCFPRYMKMSDVLDVPGIIIKTCERLGLEVDPAVPFMDASAKGKSTAKQLWQKAGNAVIAEVKFKGLLDHTKFGITPKHHGFLHMTVDSA